jgi:mersacidin/lichenicidin family type 2 lantibiotic
MDEFKRQSQVLLSAFVAVTGLMQQAPAHELSVEQIVRAWEDPEYRQTLTEEQKKLLPANPAGEILCSDMAGNTLCFVATNNDGCSTDNCSGNRCSTDACSGNRCSTDACSGNRCSTDACSGHRCGMIV